MTGPKCNILNIRVWLNVVIKKELLYILVPCNLKFLSNSYESDSSVTAPQYCNIWEFLGTSVTQTKFIVGTACSWRITEQVTSLSRWHRITCRKVKFCEFVIGSGEESEKVVTKLVCAGVTKMRNGVLHSWQNRKINIWKLLASVWRSRARKFKLTRISKKVETLFSHFPRKIDWLEQIMQFWFLRQKDFEQERCLLKFLKTTYGRSWEKEGCVFVVSKKCQLSRRKNTRTQAIMLRADHQSRSIRFPPNWYSQTKNASWETCKSKTFCMETKELANRATH